MERLKQYSAAVAAAALSLIFLIVGALALTVFAPAQELASSVVPERSLVMTRDGVLPLLAKNVTVTASSESGAPVALGLGTPGDVLGWIGEDPYTEVVGLSSDRSLLKVEDHPGASGAADGAPQSGAQSGAQSAGPDSAPAQSGAQSAPQSGSQSASPSGAIIDQEAAALVEALAASDMWLETASDEGSASLTLDDVAAARSLLAVSAGGPGDLRLTLTWPIDRANMLAIVSLLGALVFALIAAVAGFSRFHLLRHRAERAERIAARAGADVTETQTFDSRELAALTEAGRTADAPGPADADPARGSEGEADGADEDPAAARTQDGAPDQLEESMEPEDVHSPEDADEPPSEDGAETAAPGPADEDEGRDAEGGDSRAPESAPAAGAPEGGAEAAGGEPEPAERVLGRHGSGIPVDQDPPERVPTDTGIIDLSGIRPGVTLPSRRALREAREKGEGTLIIDGREFDTGLIPVVDSAADERAPQAQAPSADSGDAPLSAEAPEKPSTSGWTSMMAGWLKKDQGGK